MDPEVKKLLEETHALARDSHRMLRAIRRAQLVGFVGKVVIWIIVLLLPLYLYQRYLEPIVSQVAPAGTSGTGLFGLPTTADLQKLIESYQAR